MKYHFTIEEVRRASEVCEGCEHHKALWENARIFYCLKHKTDSIVYLVDKCDKLNELK